MYRQVVRFFVYGIKGLEANMGFVLLYRGFWAPAELHARNEKIIWSRIKITFLEKKISGVSVYFMEHWNIGLKSTEKPLQIKALVVFQNVFQRWYKRYRQLFAEQTHSTEHRRS